MLTHWLRFAALLTGSPTSTASLAGGAAVGAAAALALLLGCIWLLWRRRHPPLHPYSPNNIFIGHLGLFSQISADNMKLVRALDRGSFGVVYHMQMIHDNSDVAVKVVPMEGPRSQRTILKEVEMLRHLSNPNVVQFYGAALATNEQLSRLLGNPQAAKESVLLVTELAQLGSLYDFYYESEHEYIKPWLQRVDLGRQIAAGVHYLHTHSVLHCDLKSKNVVLKRGEEGRVIAKLCDFGQSLMMMTQSQRSTMPSVRGTLAWCAPEVLGCVSPEYTTQTDVFSLGMILYELAALKPPFNGAVDVPSLIMSGKRPEFPEDTPEAYRNIVEGCWSHEPRSRPSATEVCRRLTDIMAALKKNTATAKVFLSHNWGRENANHKKVARVYQSLERNGVKCWFDERDMQCGNVMEKMAFGIEDSNGFLAFITDEYRIKVNGDNEFDNCRYEFMFAGLVRRDKMQAVVLEPQMRDTRAWGGTLGAMLGIKIYTDMCDLDSWDDGQLDAFVKRELVPKLGELGVL